MTTNIPTWTAVCMLDDIAPDTGVCALVNGQHVAVFRVGTEQLFAIDNRDPKSGASVISRGLVGNLGEHIVVASPMYKNHFDLRTGVCLEAAEYSVRPYAVKVSDGHVLLSVD
jgi:nitrite reductase (NADH) small subunit